MSDPRERKKGTSRSEPGAGTRPKGSRPAPSGSSDGGGPGFLEQLRQRLAQAPAGAEPGSKPAQTLEDLDGSESEGIDLVHRGGPKRGDSDDDDFEPTMLLQTPNLMSQVRETLREEPP